MVLKCQTEKETCVRLHVVVCLTCTNDPALKQETLGPFASRRSKSSVSSFAISHCYPSRQEKHSCLSDSSHRDYLYVLLHCLRVCIESLLIIMRTFTFSNNRYSQSVSYRPEGSWSLASSVNLNSWLFLYVCRTVRPPGHPHKRRTKNKS